jgi:Zn-dependent peptidase ImmA (M78 family)
LQRTPNRTEIAISSTFGPISLGVTLAREQTPGWAGAARVVDGAAWIWVDATQPPPLQRFAAAHELGHLLQEPLDADTTFRCRHFFIRDQHCAAADRFALDLLAPAWMLGPVSLSRTPGVLAEMFEMPEGIMRQRLLELMGVPSAE